MTASKQLTSSAAAIRASRLASPAKGEANPTLAISGRKCIDSFEKSGRDGSFARTLMATLNAASTPYFLTWKQRVTPAGRLLFQLVPSGRLIGGTAYGLLPTPLASDWKGRWGRKDDNLLKNYLPRRFGGNCPHPSLVEAMMGFPPSWTDLAHSETPSCPKSLN
jgi:hypothetical protein